MQELQRIYQYSFQCPERCRLRRILIIVKPGFHHLNIPVAEFLPYKIIHLLHGDSQLIFIHIFRNVFCQGIHLRKNPFIRPGQKLRVHFFRNLRFFQVHHNETRRIPYLVCKVSAGLYALHIKTHIISRRISGNQCKPQRICAIFIYDFQRVNAVAQRFAHFPPLRVADKPMNQHMVERRFPCLLQRRKYHADYPEEYDIISRHQHICREEIVQILRFFRPSQSRKRPQR